MKNYKARLQKIVGKEKVLDDPETLKEYSEDYSSASGVMPELVVKAQSEKQIRKIIKLANKESFPIIPVSSGAPHFNGDTIPKADNAVIVDLQEVNSIEWIDRRNRVAVIESGVTFEDLQPALAKEGLRGLMPLSPKAKKSVIASYWEREPLTSPRFQWDSMDPITSMELLLGSGQSLFAGEIGTLKGTKEQQRKRGYSHKHPFGNMTLNAKKLGGASQGSMGICPWAAIKCEILPEYEELFFVTDEKLENLTEMAHQLVYLRLADDIFILNSLNLACLLRIDEKDIKDLKNSLPPWILILSISGYGILPQEMFEYKKAEFDSVCPKHALTLAGIEPKKISGLLRTTSNDPFWKLRLKGNARELFFQTATRKAPIFVEDMKRLAEKADFPEEQLGFYIQPERQGSCCHLEFNFNIPPFNTGEINKVEKLVNAAALSMFQSGAFFSRPYGDQANLIFSHCSQTANQLRNIKKMFDPKGIMSPGRLCFG